jgi:hypothetical protein
MPATTVPVVQLPVDLQNQLRSGTGLSQVSHALGGLSPSSLLIGAVIVLGTAAVVSGLLAVLMSPAEMFAEPKRWVPLVVGAVALGTLFGSLSRLDLRPKGIGALLVGPTCLVIVRRDTVRVFPAESITRGPNTILYNGKPIDRHFHVTEFTRALDAAKRAAADPAACASDRWRAAAVGIAAPVRRWTPVLHGAVLAASLAVALEAGLGGLNDRDPGDWDAIASRTRTIESKIVAARTNRIDDAVKRGPAAILVLLKSHDGDDPKVASDLVTAMTTQLRKQIDAATSVTSIESTMRIVLAASNEPKAGPVSDLLGLGRQRFAKLAAEAPDDQLKTTLQRARLFDVFIAADLLGRLDPILLAEAAELPSADANALGELLDELHTVLPDAQSMTALPKTHRMLVDRAEDLIANAKPDDYRFLLDEDFPVVSEKALRKVLERARSFDELDAIRAAARRLRSDVKVESAVARVLASELAGAKEPDDFQHLLDVSERYGDHGPRIRARAMAIVRALRDLETLAEWESFFFDDAEFDVEARAAQLALTGKLADARAYLTHFDAGDASEQVTARIEKRCAALYRGTSVQARVARQLCELEEPTLSWSNDGYSDDVLGEQVAAQLASELTALSKAAGEPMLVVPELLPYGVVEITVDVSDDAFEQAQTKADESRKPRALACPATITWSDDDTVKLKRTYQCTVHAQ